MTMLHCPSPGFPTPSSSIGGHSTTTASPRLRDSCDACATSKLRCSKEKPTCSRCAKRGLTCEYVAMKRSGRKPSSRSNIADPRGNEVSKTIGITNCLTPYSFISSTDPLPSPGQTMSSSSEAFPTLFSPMTQTMASANTELDMDLDNFLVSSMTFSMPEVTDSDILGETDFISVDTYSNGNGSDAICDSFPEFGDAVSDFPDLSVSNSPLNNRTPPAENLQSCHKVYTPVTVCSCLVHALGLMKQLVPPPSYNCLTSATQVLDRTTSTPTFKTVVAKNKTIIEAVSMMLKCTCSHDGYLLVIIALIVFKVLDWYGAAARKMSLYKHSHTSKYRQNPQLQYSSHFEQMHQSSDKLSSYCVDGEHSARMAAQLVLSELHRVRRVVNQLSTKLKADRKASAQYNCNADSEIELPLLAGMLGQFDVDLRKRLKALSSRILESLRKM